MISYVSLPEGKSGLIQHNVTTINHRATFASVTSILRQNCAASARVPSWKRSFKLRFGGLGGFGGGFLDPGFHHISPYFTEICDDLRFKKDQRGFLRTDQPDRESPSFFSESQTGPRKPLWAGSTFRGMVTLNPKVRFDINKWRCHPSETWPKKFGCHQKDQKHQASHHKNPPVDFPMICPIVMDSA